MKKNLLFAILVLSFNANAQWVQTNGPYGGQSVRCLAVSGTNIFAGTNSGVFISSNNGNLWTQVNNGLTNTQVQSLTISGSNIFVGTYGGVFLSSNNGSSWTASSNGLSGSFDTVVKALVTNGTDIFAGIYDGTGGVNISSNNGSSWTAVNNGLPLVQPFNDYEILELGISGNNIFTQSRGFGMFLSSNNGGSWLAVNNGFQNDGNKCAFASSGSDIYVGNSYGVFYSNNNGGLWANHNNGLPSNGVLSIAISGSNIFAGTNSGVWLSDNNGVLWTNASTNGIANQAVISFAIIGNNIFAGTNNSGVWTRPLSEMTGIVENNMASDFNIFPNPNNGTFKIEAKENNYMLIITNVLGEKIYQFEIKNEKSEIDLSKEPIGMYFIKIKSEKGTISKKLIVNK